MEKNAEVKTEFDREELLSSEVKGENNYLFYLVTGIVIILLILLVVFLLIWKKRENKR